MSFISHVNSKTGVPNHHIVHLQRVIWGFLTPKSDPPFPQGWNSA